MESKPEPRRLTLKQFGGSLTITPSRRLQKRRDELTRMAERYTAEWQRRQLEFVMGVMQVEKEKQDG